ncbi:MAG TPA: TIGR02757 family protein [Flavitalea sp.]|nr:TIGR02757 family protein [Flavitalea sp.]
MQSSLTDFLNRKVSEYNRPEFIKDDPVAIPHLFRKKQDIEIAAFFAATFAWGIRATIIAKSTQLMQLMDMSPYDFIRNHQPGDLKSFLHFKHRTFNTTDLLYFIHFLQQFYQEHKTLEDLFFSRYSLSMTNPVEAGLNNLYSQFFSLEDAPARTRKHIACPARNSSCKRLNMFLRWMVRNDQQGVDFGLWKKISPAQLICPVDLHVARVATRFGLLNRKQVDWQSALTLTEELRKLDPEDPVKYDYALFALGIMERF